MWCWVSVVVLVENGKVRNRQELQYYRFRWLCKRNVRARPQETKLVFLWVIIGPQWRTNILGAFLVSIGLSYFPSTFLMMTAADSIMSLYTCFPGCTPPCPKVKGSSITKEGEWIIERVTRVSQRCWEGSAARQYTLHNQDSKPLDPLHLQYVAASYSLSWWDTLHYIYGLGCFVDDIVVVSLVMLKVVPRVLYHHHYTSPWLPELIPSRSQLPCGDLLLVLNESRWRCGLTCFTIIKGIMFFVSQRQTPHDITLSVRGFVYLVRLM